MLASYCPSSTAKVYYYLSAQKWNYFRSAGSQFSQPPENPKRDKRLESAWIFLLYKQILKAKLLKLRKRVNLALHAFIKNWVN